MRIAYGFPVRTECEPAWGRHALARLREGGVAVLLGRLGDQLVRGMYDGLTDGTVTPD